MSYMNIFHEQMEVKVLAILFQPLSRVQLNQMLYYSQIQPTYLLRVFVSSRYKIVHVKPIICSCYVAVVDHLLTFVCETFTQHSLHLPTLMRAHTCKTLHSQLVTSVVCPWLVEERSHSFRIRLPSRLANLHCTNHQKHKVLYGLYYLLGGG